MASSRQAAKPIPLANVSNLKHERPVTAEYSSSCELRYYEYVVPLMSVSDVDHFNCRASRAAVSLPAEKGAIDATGAHKKEAEVLAHCSFH